MTPEDKSDVQFIGTNAGIAAAGIGGMLMFPLNSGWDRALWIILFFAAGYGLANLFGFLILPYLPGRNVDNQPDYEPEKPVYNEPRQPRGPVFIQRDHHTLVRDPSEVPQLEERSQ